MVKWHQNYRLLHQLPQIYNPFPQHANRRANQSRRFHGQKIPTVVFWRCRYVKTDTWLAGVRWEELVNLSGNWKTTQVRYNLSWINLSPSSEQVRVNVCAWFNLPHHLMNVQPSFNKPPRHILTYTQLMLLLYPIWSELWLAAVWTRVCQDMIWPNKKNEIRDWFGD